MELHTPDPMPRVRPFPSAPPEPVVLGWGTATPPHRYAQLEVADTGPGIASDALPSIFERFFRGDPARSRATGGTGLGLAIVRNFLRRMGGRISVASREGEGTTFRVELPPNPARPLLGAGQPEFY